PAAGFLWGRAPLRLHRGPQAHRIEPAFTSGSGCGVDGQHIPLRITQVEPSSSGEGEDVLLQGAYGLQHRTAARLEIEGEQNRKRASFADLLGEGEAAGLMRSIGAADPGVLGAVVVELPAEGLAVEAAGARHVADGELDVSELVMRGG